MSVSLLMVAVDKGLLFILMSTCLSWLTSCSEVMEKKLGFFSFLFFFFCSGGCGQCGCVIHCNISLFVKADSHNVLKS